MDKVTSLPHALAALVLSAALAACGGAVDGREVRARDAAPTFATPVVSRPLPTAEEMGRLPGAGIQVVGRAATPAVERTLDAAAKAASADAGGLMAPGVEPDAAWFGKITTPRHGATTGKGQSERVVPEIQDGDAWLLIYRDATVPVGGGRGPQYDPSGVNPTGSADAGVRAATVTLVVVVDAASGRFLFAHSL